MTDLFLTMLNRGLVAGWLVLAVLALRLLLRKAPKSLHCLVWALVALRLLCPVSLPSAFSLIPSSQTVSPQLLSQAQPAIDSGLPLLDEAVQPLLDGPLAPTPAASVDPLQLLITTAAWLWLAGLIAMLLYAALSTWRLRSRLRTAVRLRDNIWRSEAVDSPFVLGILRPRIYLPFTLTAPCLDLVLAHEQAHILRRDHWWKPLGFLLLALYWFNPLLWLAYVLFCRDVELACDQRVIGDFGGEQRRAYSQALLACSLPRRSLTACPLAFGEVGVKQRIRHILSFRRPALWLLILALLLSAAAAVCLLTDPQPLLEPEQVEQVLVANEGGYIEAEGGAGLAQLLARSRGRRVGDAFLTRSGVEEAAALLTTAQGEYSLLPYTPEADPLLGPNQRALLHWRGQDGREKVWLLEQGFWAQYSAWRDNVQSPAPVLPSSCLYLSPLSSQLPEQDYLYSVDADSLTVWAQNSEAVALQLDNVVWDWQAWPYSEEAWQALFLGLPGPTLSAEDNPRYLPLSANYFLVYTTRSYHRPWLVRVHEDGYIWSIFQLEPASHAHCVSGRETLYRPEDEGWLATEVEVPEGPLALAKDWARDILSRWQTEVYLGDYTGWRIQDLRYVYTYEDFEGQTLDVYRMNVELRPTDVDKITLAGGIYVTADGWCCASYPDMYYLVLEQASGQLLCRVGANDVSPGTDEGFLNDVRSVLRDQALRTAALDFLQQYAPERMADLSGPQQDLAPDIMPAEAVLYPTADPLTEPLFTLTYTPADASQSPIILYLDSAAQLYAAVL